MAKLQAELRASTSSTSCQGSPYAAELDTRLRSDEPLADIVDWWREKYREWRSTLDPDVVEGVGPISKLEWTVYCVDGSEDNPDSDIQAGWDYLKEDRAALQAQASS
jgi:hypothetical protein